MISLIMLHLGNAYTHGCHCIFKYGRQESSRITFVKCATSPHCIFHDERMLSIVEPNSNLLVLWFQDSVSNGTEQVLTKQQNLVPVA